MPQFKRWSHVKPIFKGSINKIDFKPIETIYNIMDKHGIKRKIDSNLPCQFESC